MLVEVLPKRRALAGLDPLVTRPLSAAATAATESALEPGAELTGYPGEITVSATDLAESEALGDDGTPLGYGRGDREQSEDAETSGEDCSTGQETVVEAYDAPSSSDVGDCEPKNS
ncbi:hypothetical protein ON010_g5910 [Phytophthora cinnamomi]|nr:hypothetical protein ON010_g5910 [Phytophthora cinnamomi]